MKKYAALLSLLLAGCLMMTGCLFGGVQSEPLPDQTQEGQTRSEEAEAPEAESSMEGSADSPVVISSEVSEAGETPAATSAQGPETPAASTQQAASPESSQSGPVGPVIAETTTAEANEQIMTVTAGSNSMAWQILSRLDWADTVWADSEDYCHLRITDLSENGITFYWHTRVDTYPTTFQSQLCTAAFAENVISCNYSDERDNTGVIRLTVRDQAISFDQTIVHSGNYSPDRLQFTLLPKASGTEAFFFRGTTWRAHMASRNKLYSQSGGSAYQSIVNGYIENTLEITDVSGNSIYLLDSHTRFYTEAELSGFSKDLIKLFKNEIYARHGYRFDSKDLYDLFLHFMWYYPDFSPKNFNENVLNQYEKENLKLLVKLEGK